MKNLVTFHVLLLAFAILGGAAFVIDCCNPFTPNPDAVLGGSDHGRLLRLGVQSLFSVNCIDIRAYKPAICDEFAILRSRTQRFFTSQNNQIII